MCRMHLNSINKSANKSQQLTKRIVKEGKKMLACFNIYIISENYIMYNSISVGV